jgi:hypothetical protein
MAKKFHENLGLFLVRQDCPATVYNICTFMVMGARPHKVLL